MLSNSRWRERWCRVKDNRLIFHKDRTDLKTHIVSVPLRGCDVIPGLDSKHPLTFRLLRNGQEVAVLEVRCHPRPRSQDPSPWLPAVSFVPPPPPWGSLLAFSVASSLGWCLFLPAVLHQPSARLPFPRVPLHGDEIRDFVQCTGS